MNKIFISGIDTDAGKTYATAWLARKFMDEGKSVITQKFIQTGNTDESEDIVAHRRLMGIEMLPEDNEKVTAPIIFTYPASAQLAARIDGKEIDVNLIDRSTKILTDRYDVVLIEGAGGLMVPLTDDFFTIDYVSSRKLPVALVTNGKLGSINHTILSLEALAARNIDVPYVLYSQHLDNDKIISEDTQGFIKRYLAKHYPETELLFVPVYNK
ncbi:MAG: dethiobiotin synthase [Muribaculaceae bacterium]|nr:dethiobiotin synthase [Muribaculaceae bacterium]MDE7093108.1 dethiobiotin synthase [Muribaculaceae bacterium]